LRKSGPAQMHKLYEKASAQDSVALRSKLSLHLN
jgi:hypothetical protein